MSDTKHTKETKLKQDNFRIRFDDEEEDFVAECNDHDDVEALIHRYNMHPSLLEALEEIGKYTGKGGPGAPWQEIVRDLGEIARKALATARA